MITGTFYGPKAQMWHYIWLVYLNFIWHAPAFEIYLLLAAFFLQVLIYYCLECKILCHGKQNQFSLPKNLAHASGLELATLAQTTHFAKFAAAKFFFRGLGLRRCRDSSFLPFWSAVIEHRNDIGKEKNTSL